MFIKSIHDIPQNRRIHIYGTGAYGLAAKKGLERAGIGTIIAFLDSFQAGNLDGLPIIKINDYLSHRRPDDLILIASTYWREISKKLIALGIEDYLVDPDYFIDELCPATYDPAWTEANAVLRTERFDRIGGQPPGTPSLPPLAFSLIVWGDAYLDLMIRYALPAFLSAGNLPAVAKRTPVRIFLQIGSDQAERFKDTPVFARLREVADITMSVVRIPDFKAEHPDPDAADFAKYVFLFHLFTHFIRQSGQEMTEPALGFLAPDMVAADGYIDFAVRQLEEGYRAVYSPELNVDRDKFLSEMNTVPGLVGQAILSISARDLVKKAITAVHDLYGCHFVGAEPFYHTPCRYFVDVPGQGVVYHAFHMHHFLVWPRREVRFFRVGFDHDYLFRALDPTDRIYDPVSSDEMFHVNMTPSHGNFTTMPRFDAEEIGYRTATMITSKIQDALLRRSRRLVHTHVDEAAWRSAEAVGIRTVEMVLQVKHRADLEKGIMPHLREALARHLQGVSGTGGNEVAWNRIAEAALEALRSTPDFPVLRDSPSLSPARSPGSIPVLGDAAPNDPPEAVTEQNMEKGSRLLPCL